MGFKKSWDAGQIKGQLRRMAFACSDYRNDGYIQSSIKHELIELKFLLDDLIEQCPKFAGEDEWYYDRVLEKLGKHDEDSSS